MNPLSSTFSLNIDQENLFNLLTFSVKSIIIVSPIINCINIGLLTINKGSFLILFEPKFVIKIIPKRHLKNAAAKLYLSYISTLLKGLCTHAINGNTLETLKIPKVSSIS